MPFLLPWRGGSCFLPPRRHQPPVSVRSDGLSRVETSGLVAHSETHLGPRVQLESLSLSSACWVPSCPEGSGAPGQVCAGQQRRLPGRQG